VTLNLLLLSCLFVNTIAPNMWGKQHRARQWPWPLTYDIELQSQASQGQGRPSCQKSRSKVKRFKQESAHRQTYYLPCYAVDKKLEPALATIAVQYSSSLLNTDTRSVSQVMGI